MIVLCDVRLRGQELDFHGVMGWPQGAADDAIWKFREACDLFRNGHFYQVDEPFITSLSKWDSRC